MSLSAFFAQNAIKPQAVDYVASERFQDADGKPIAWKIKPITAKENKDLMKRYTNTVPISGKRGQYRQDMDSPEYTTALAVACTEFPNLNDKELQDSYGVMGAEKLLSVMLLPGEFTEYSAKVQEVCGFDIGLAEKVDVVKN